MKINKYLSKYNHNKGKASRIKYIVIHYVGAIGDAKANCQFYAGGNKNASAHYFVGFKGDIWQSVEDKNVAWHCGAKQYKHKKCRNANSIGIEMCVRNEGSKAATSKDWYFEQETVNATIELTKALMKKYKIPVENVLRHYDVTGKICPNPYVYNLTKHTWKKFLQAVTGKKEAESKSKPQQVTSNKSNQEYKVRVDIKDLRIRKGPGTNYDHNGYTGKGTFTIINESKGKGAVLWGCLKSGAGWIALDYAKKI